MKSRTDLVKNWLAKAESDLAGAELCLAAGRALDTACFHAQQASEKILKAFLIAHDVDYPHMHDLTKLVDLCGKQDAAFVSLKDAAAQLTPFAVELRYDTEFWPTADMARQAVEMAGAIRSFVLDRLPEDCRPS